MSVCGVRVATVVPAFNEANHIAEVLRGIPALVDTIVVVDDGSTDGTREAVLGCDDPRVILVSHESNAGLGAAMRSGYQRVLDEGSDIAVKLDADGQMDPAELERLVTPIARGSADYAKGNRFYFRGAAASMPTKRSFGNTVLSFGTKLASGYWHVYDSQCGYTAIRRGFLRLMDLDSLPDDYFFENAMLIQLNSLNARVVDVPVSTLYGSEVSGINIAKVALTFPPRLVGAAFGRFWRKHLVTDFGAIGAMTIMGSMLMTFGALFGAFHWWRSVATRVATTTGTVMIAVLPLMLGVQLITQAWVLSVQSSPGAEQTAEYVRELVLAQETSEEEHSRRSEPQVH